LEQETIDHTGSEFGSINFSFSPIVNRPMWFRNSAKNI